MKLAKLIHVSIENGKTGQSNKFYEMRENADGTFTVEYGRVGCAKPATETYPMSKWNDKYYEKTGPRKNYKDVTNLFQEVISENTSNRTKISEIKNPAIKLLFDDLRKYANKSIEENYKVTQDSVTEMQVKEAQSIIDKINSNLCLNANLSNLNTMLMELYVVIPRKMKDVRENLFKGFATKDDLNNAQLKMKEEQDTLDTMAGQVELLKQQKLTTSEKIEVNEDIDLLKSMGLEVTEVDATELNMIRNLMGSNSRQLRKAFKIINKKTEDKFIKNVSNAGVKKTQLFWHGSRNQNWFNIIQTGLLIRPSGAAYTGSMFGDGIYGADKAQKSIGYSSLSGSCWAGGNSNKAYLALFEFHVGNQKHITNHTSDCYTLNKSKLQHDGYDSVYAHGGADLRNNEYIVYDSCQVTIKYLIEIGN